MAAAGGRAVRGAVAALALLLPILGCTDDDPAPEPAAAPTTAAPVAPGTVRLGLSGPIVADPLDASPASSSDLMVLDLLHDGLTRLDDEGVAEPALASRWVANDTHTAFRFQLATEATFASGREVTPADVIASLERVMAAGDTSLAALSLETVTGFRAFVDGEAEHVSGLSAPDERTVRVALTTPLAVLPEVLSSPLLGVVDVDGLEDGELAALDLSGAWTVADVDDDDDVLRLDHRSGAPGELNGVELHPFEDDGGAYAAFDDSEVDWATVPGDRYDQALDDHGDDSFAPFHAELFFGMNLSTPNLADPALRQAIVQAIDRDEIVQDVYPDLADPLSTIVPAGVLGHEPASCAACSYDPDAAEATLQAAFPDGAVPTVRIDFDESPAQEAMAELIASDLDDVGIPTELRPLPLEEYKRFVVSGDQELFSFGWIGAYGSPDAYLAPLFGSASDDNLTDHRSDEVDGLLGRVRSGADPAQNAERWVAAEQQILEAAAVIPIAQFRTQVVVAERLQGFVHAVDGTVNWSQVRLED